MSEGAALGEQQSAAMSLAPELPAVPELGPRVVFFTGGTALRALSQHLTPYTHNSVHLVTPFDSGGSSAALRRAFGMPAVGDVRNRLLALADTTLVPSSVLDVCNRRLPDTGDRDALLQQLYALASEKDPCWQDVPRIFGEVLRVHLRYFLEKMPPTFDPCKASVGNLVLAGGYLHHRGQFGPVLGLMSRLLHVRGTVLPIVSESLHLAAELLDGSVVVGQHKLTGYGAPSPLASPIHRLFLTVHTPESARQPHQPCVPTLHPLAATYIRAADAICYPMGSFFTSVVANLMPAGVGSAVAEARCPKVYIPNTGSDPEQAHLTVAASVATLLGVLRQDAGDVPASQLLQKVVLDLRGGTYACGVDVEGITAQGVEVCDIPLGCADQKHDAELTARAVMQIARR